MVLMMPDSTPWRLISLPMSHYCEKVRWALDWLGVSYTEEPHMFPFHRQATQLYGGTSVPVLVTSNQVLKDSSDMLTFLDQFVPDPLCLYPRESEQKQTINQLEPLLKLILGPATRRWFYYYALKQDELLHYCWCQGTPDREQAVYLRMLPRMKTMVQSALDISVTSVEQSLETIYQVFEQVERFLADGRPYLLGDAMSALDITLAALAAPILLPPEHPITALNALPPEPSRAMVQEVLACRTSLTGEFVLRLYQQKRHASQERDLRTL